MDDIHYCLNSDFVLPLESQIFPRVLKQNFGVIVEGNDVKYCKGDKNYNIEIMPIHNTAAVTDNDSSVSQVTAHLKDRLTVKSGSGVNGIVNGLSVSVDIPQARKQDHFSNCEILGKSSSQCHKRDVCSGCDNSTQIFNSVSNCAENVEQNECVKDAACCDDTRLSGHNLDRSSEDEIQYVSYKSELQMPDIMRLIQKDLSEPYSIYTYRYFIHNWPKLCFLAMDGTQCVGAIVCKLDVHRKVVKRGYIAMLAVDERYRKRKIGSNLVLKAIRAMVADDADEVVLETEITNQPALRLYENLGFVRDKRLFRYYLNGVDALRLKLWLR
ncbi:N-alpha-acetyltransferase 30 [Bacillus rossius redtenbacheri]|uniref:N-alpha-acetyltransferase 30 n=1 Tax=Bacillus rossius redtenbacheri TaxID=93214 RepID=UPI002FDD39AC